VAELKGDKSHRKSIGDRLSHNSSKSNTVRSKAVSENALVEVEQEEEDSKADEKAIIAQSESILRDEIKSPENKSEHVETPSNENQPEQEESEQQQQQSPTPKKQDEENLGDDKKGNLEKEANKSDEKEAGEEAAKEEEEEEEEERDDENAKENEIPIDSATFEIINKETNTERKFLENINFDDSNNLTEAELKSTVFNAYQTIEKLQNDLMYCLFFSKDHFVFGSFLLV
jgi:hypothetical protein